MEWLDYVCAQCCAESCTIPRKGIILAFSPLFGLVIGIIVFPNAQERNPELILNSIPSLNLSYPVSCQLLLIWSVVLPLLLPYFGPLIPQACTVSTIAPLVVCTSNLSPSSSSMLLSKWSFRNSNMTVTPQLRLLLWFPNICTLYKTLYDDDAVQLYL